MGFPSHYSTINEAEHFGRQGDPAGSLALGLDPGVFGLEI